MLDEVLKDEFRKLFTVYYHNKNEIRGINTELQDQIKELAKKMEMKPTKLSKALAYKFRLAEKGEDDIADIQSVLTETED